MKQNSKETTWLEDLETKFKNTEKAVEKRKVILVAEDEIAHKLLVAWPLVDRELTGSEWEDCVFSYNEWCMKAGLPAIEHNIGRCEMLMAQELVLPDGRLHFWVAKMLEKIAVKVIKVTRLYGEEKD